MVHVTDRNPHVPEAMTAREALSPGHEDRSLTRREWRRFSRHYVEMAAAMGVGMLVFGGALRAALAAVGVEYSMAHFPTLVIVEMAADMALGMAAWMRYRRHRWSLTLEMSAAMLVPAVAVLPLIWLSVLAAGMAMLLEHVAMFLLMLAVMLRRRVQYATVHTHEGRLLRSSARVLRLAGRGLLPLFAFLVVPAVGYTASSTSYEESRYTPFPAADSSAQAVAAAATPRHDPTKPTAVKVIGSSGANAADALVPYAVLASTGAFNVHTVAPERRPLPLLGGLDLVPDLSFTQLRQRLDGAAPDVTVVPDMPTSGAADATPSMPPRAHVRTWARVAAGSAGGRGGATSD